jgi:hypothetical protein
MGSFWDVVSGKNYRFNAVRSEVHCQVTAAIRKFLSVDVLPEFRHYIDLLRDTLFTYLICANQRIAAYPELERYRQGIQTANKSGYMHVIASLHAFFNVFEWHMLPRLAAVRLAAIHDIYEQDDVFGWSWSEALLSASSSNGMREFEVMAGRFLYHEISPALGLQQPSDNDIYLWTKCANPSLPASGDSWGIL